MQLSQPTLEPHSLCYTFWVQVVYSHFPLVLFGDTLLLLSSCRREGVNPELPGVRGLLGVSSPSRRPCGAQLLSFVLVLYASAVSDSFVINVINNIRIHFIISFYVICAVIYCSFYCIYVWLDPGTYMIARFMSFYEPGVTNAMGSTGVWFSVSCMGERGCNVIRCRIHHTSRGGKF